MSVPAALCEMHVAWMLRQTQTLSTRLHLSEVRLLYYKHFLSIFFFFWTVCLCVIVGSPHPKHTQLFHLFPSSVLLQCDQQKRVREAMSEHNTGKEAFPPPQTRSSHSISNSISVSFALFFFFFKRAWQNLGNLACLSKWILNRLVYRVHGTLYPGDWKMVKTDDWSISNLPTQLDSAHLWHQVAASALLIISLTTFLQKKWTHTHAHPPTHTPTYPHTHNDSVYTSCLDFSYEPRCPAAVLSCVYAADGAVTFSTMAA